MGWGLVCGWGVEGRRTMRNTLRLTALMDGAEHRPKWRYTDRVSSVFVCVCPCARAGGREGGNVCVNSFPLSQLPIPWTRWEWVELEGCLWAERVWEKAWYRERSLFSVQKGSDQLQQWLWFINIFRYTIVFFSGGREEVLSAACRPIIPPLWPTNTSRQPYYLIKLP